MIGVFMMAKKTQNQVIAEFKEVHGDKYDYSKVIYTAMAEKVTVTCPVHGDWDIRPFAHKNGQGCMKCRGYCGGNKNTNESITKKAKAVHGDRYDYSKMKFESILKKIEIVCPDHGSFWQTPDNHIRNKNTCPDCIIRRGASKESKKAFSPIIKELKKRNIEFYFDDTEFGIQIGNTSSKYHLDLYIPSLHMNIEYQGAVWHPDYYALSTTEWAEWTQAKGTINADTKMKDDMNKSKFLFDTIHCTTWLVTPSLVDHYVSLIIDIIRKAP